MDRLGKLLAPAGVLLGAAGFAAALTCLYRGMRSVMYEAGGFCAQGGPYEIANECTNGQVALMLIGVFAMLIFGGVFAGASNAYGSSAMGAGFLMWGALFGALGWNFVELGLDQPGPMGLAWGWIVCGAVFWLMAAGGFWGAFQLAREWAGQGGEPEQLFEPPLVRALVNEPREGAADE